MERRQGCLEGIIELILLRSLFDFLQNRFGFGRGCSCSGFGCGIILLILLIVFSCSILTRTDFTRMF